MLQIIYVQSIHSGVSRTSLTQRNNFIQQEETKQEEKTGGVNHHDS